MSDPDHERVAREIVAAMVKHPIHHNGIPSKDISAGFHPEMVDPIWDDIGASIANITESPMRKFDVHIEITLLNRREFRNTKSLGIYDFEPVFYGHKPFANGTRLTFGGTYDGGLEYGFTIYMGDVQPEDDDE